MSDMRKRFEYKYKVPNEHLDSLRERVTPFLKIDPFANREGKKEYIVRSIYLDNLRLSSYFEKIEGLPYRNKFRIRGYNEETARNTVFLEIKRKHLNNIAKTRVPLSYNNLSDVLNRQNGRINVEVADDKLIRNIQSFLYYYYRNRLQPVILIVYNREAFSGRFDNSLRLTFDKNIRSIFMPEFDDLFLDEHHFTPAMKNYFVLEFKFFDTVPLWFKQIVNDFNLARSAISKYTICIDSHIKNKAKWRSTFNNSGYSNGSRLPALMMRNLLC